MAKRRKKQQPGIRKQMTKSQLYSELAESADITKKQVGLVMEELELLIERHIRKGAAGQFAVPGLMKIKAVKRPARAARKGVPNPFRPGELMDIAAKPASIRVKVTPLKKLKDMVR